MFSLCMMWLLAGGVIGVASVPVPMSAAEFARIAQPHCLLSNSLFYLLSTPFHRYCCLASNSGNAESAFRPELFAMSTNNMSTDVTVNSTQVQKATSTRYSPLLQNGDSFRLLRVLPSLRHGSPIRCELFTSSISRERDQFIAGSYVWGPPEPKRSILLDGGPFQVRDNLFRFLTAFRSRNQPQVIWLDAICINQDDIQERSHQVQEMKRIYSGAKCVYSWLGHDKPLPHTGTFNRQYIIDLYYRCMRDNRQHTRHKDQSEYILQADYWSRMWIVQEFILAKKVKLLVGRKRLPCNELENIILCTPLPEEWTGILRSRRRFTALILYRSVRGSFERLFEHFGMLPRSVPLDGVFALLGLLKGTEKDLRLISIIDYSLTVWQLLQQILALDILDFPFKFAEQYNRYVIKDQRDDYMGGYVSMELKQDVYWNLSGAERAAGSSLNTVMTIRASRAIRYSEATNNDTVEVAVNTPRWRTIAVRSGISVELSFGLLSTKPSYLLRTRALVEACDSQCATSCTTHAVVGFSWISWRYPKKPYEPASIISIDVPLSASHASGDVSRLIHNIQQRSMELVEAMSSKVRMIATGRSSDHQNPILYKLETDVETMVMLSTFIKDLETHKGWQGLLDLATEWVQRPGTEEDAARPK